MVDSYLYLVVALLPLAAAMVVLQDDPYHALVIRGILGAVATMSYAVLGAADVALTEALVGTMLAITLYAIAVRSSLVMRLGVLATESAPHTAPQLAQLIDTMRTTLKKHHLRLELQPYPSVQALEQALIDREVHGICDEQRRSESTLSHESGPYRTMIRVHRLYDILQSELPSQIASLSYVDVAHDSPLKEAAANRKPINLEDAPQ